MLPDPILQFLTIRTFQFTNSFKKNSMNFLITASCLVGPPRRSSQVRGDDQVPNELPGVRLHIPRHSVCNHTYFLRADDFQTQQSRSACEE